MDCSNLFDIKLSSTLYPFTPKNIYKAICCVASRHRAIKACYLKDIYRVNSEEDYEVPSVIITYPINFQNVNNLYENHNNNTRQRLNCAVEFYVVQSHDVRNTDRSEIDMATFTYQIAIDIIYKLNKVLDKAFSGFWIETYNLEQISEFSNTIRFAKNFTGYKVSLVLSGIPSTNSCDERFEDADCFDCNNRIIPEQNICCDFDAEIEVIQFLPTGIQANVVLNPGCSDYGFIYTFRYNNIQVQTGTSNFYETNVDQDGIYDVVITNGDCSQIVSYSYLDIDCCENNETSIVYNSQTDTLLWGSNWVDFIVQCRFSITQTIIEVWNGTNWVVVSTNGILNSPAPGTYRARTVLIYGCESVSPEIIVP